MVRTYFGESYIAFGEEDWQSLDQVKGIRQGNGIVLDIWVVISSVLFDMIRDKELEMKSKAPLSKLALRMV